MGEEEGTMNTAMVSLFPIRIATADASLLPPPSLSLQLPPPSSAAVMKYNSRAADGLIDRRLCLMRAIPNLHDNSGWIGVLSLQVVTEQGPSFSLCSSAAP